MEEEEKKKKKNLDPYFMSYTKIEMQPRCKPRIIKLLEENIQGKYFQTGYGKKELLKKKVW